MGVDLPDWRTTCLVVDLDHRRERVAKAALEGALRLIKVKGGGTVDGYPIAISQGKKYSNSFIWGWNRLNVSRPRIPSTRFLRHKQTGDGDAKSGPWSVILASISEFFLKSSV